MPCCSLEPKMAGSSRDAYVQPRAPWLQSNLEVLGGGSNLTCLGCQTTERSKQGCYPETLVQGTSKLPNKYVFQTTRTELGFWNHGYLSLVGFSRCLLSCFAGKRWGRRRSFPHEAASAKLPSGGVLIVLVALRVLAEQEPLLLGFRLGRQSRKRGTL